MPISKVRNKRTSSCDSLSEGAGSHPSTQDSAQANASQNDRKGFDPNFLRSYGRRKGRVLSAPKQKLVEELLPTLLPDTNLSSDKEYWLEIGFGAGEHLEHVAKHYPDRHFIGAEPYLNGVASLLHRIQDDGLTNLNVIPDDVRPWLQAIPKHSLTGIYILFPDPWPKRSQNKRRLINTALLDLLAQTLKPEGLLRIATDHVDYSAWIMEHLSAHSAFEWKVERHTDWSEPYPDWQETRYQRKTTEEGRLPIFLEFIRKS